MPVPAGRAAHHAPPQLPKPAALTLWQEIARKLIHLGSASLPISWGLGVLSPETLRTLLTVTLSVAVLVEGARRLSAPAARMFDRLVGSMLRIHERDNITGATWLAASMLAALVILPPASAIIALWAAAVGDGSASIVGRLASRSRGPHHSGKTMVGSLACLATTAAGALWFTDATILVALAIGAVTAAAERPSGMIDDNVRVTLAAGLAAWVLGVA